MYKFQTGIFLSGRNIATFECLAMESEIPNDHNNPLSNLSFQDQVKLLATKKILKYFSDLPPEEHIHWLVIVISFLDYLPGAFSIYLNKQKMDYLMHFLDLMHLEYQNTMQYWT